MLDAGTSVLALFTVERTIESKTLALALGPLARISSLDGKDTAPTRAAAEEEEKEDDDDKSGATYVGMSFRTAAACLLCCCCCCRLARYAAEADVGAWVVFWRVEKSMPRVLEKEFSNAPRGGAEEEEDDDDDDGFFWDAVVM